MKAGLDTALRARLGAAGLVISHGPSVTAVCEATLRRVGYRGRHLAFSFNFTKLPTGGRLRLMRAAFRDVDRFLVYSTFERRLYHEALDIPLDKIEFQHWAVEPPQPQPPDRPLVAGDYACAIGGNARDYGTLMEAMRGLAHVRLVLVARPHNLSGLAVPPNVEVWSDIPLGAAMNILAHSRLMVLPLAGARVPCGHVTLVSAMHLGKAFVISNSVGVADYVEHEGNALACEPQSADALAAAVGRLWGDPALCDRLGRNGREFAGRHCSEPSMVAWLARYLADSGLLADALPGGRADDR